MKYAIVLTALGLGQVLLGCAAGTFAWLLWWSGLSWIAAGLAYACLGPRVFGKRADGAMTWWNVLLLLPFLALTWVLWHLQRRMSKEERCVEVAPGLWLGRRCFTGELPTGIRMVVDLTAEFSEPHSIRSGRQYVCLPTLDAAVPQVDELRRVVESIVASPGPVYVHCALGHGRSAMTVMAALIARGDASNLDEAEGIVTRARPGVKISACQRRLLQQMF